MPTRRVTAIATREDDLSAIEEIAVGPPLVAGRVVVCDVEEAGIQQLEQRGVLVEAVEERELPEAGALAPLPTPTIAGLPHGLTVPRGDTVDVLDADDGPARTDVYVLSVAGPLLPPWRQAVEEAGAELLERVEDGNYNARIPIDRVPAVRALDFVKDLRRFTARDTVDPRQLASHVAPPQAGLEQVTYDAYLHPGADLGPVSAWLFERSVDVAGSSRRKVRFYALRGAKVVAELARLPQVSAIEEFIPPRLANDHARDLMGLSQQDGLRTGKGQIVAVADTGIDEQHPDLSGRIRTVFARGRPNDPSDPHGHGTHVSGSVLGDGSASNGAIRGAAPGAELVFQSVMDAGGGLGGLGVDLADLFDQAYREGARIHSNSWGALAHSAYRINSLEVDAFVHDHPDMLVVIAAGNSGTAAQPVTAQRGFVDLLSVDSPGTAKNALTVGASRSDRQVEGDPTFGAWWPSEFPEPPISDAAVSGDPEALAAFSGRGPCDEQIRIKPDLVAPGTFILSARSSKAPTNHFWQEFQANRAYAFMGGTSMATPLVAGCAALAREYFMNDRDQQTPSAALLKATLINGTRWLQGGDAIADHSTEPNYHQGFGCLYMPSTLPDGNGSFRLEFRDTQHNDGESLADTGSSADYVVNVGEGELRFCLAWTDPPGRGLQNTVTMILENPQTGERWLGNPHRPAGVMPWDAGNNVQVIRLQHAKAGTYRILVVASNLLQSPQAFALVAAGALESEITRV